MSSRSWPPTTYSPRSSVAAPIINSALEQFALERLAIVRYHDAYLDALGSEGRRFQKEA